MKKIITLILSIIILTTFSVTVFAENEGSSQEESSSETGSSESSSSESESSSSSQEQVSSENSSLPDTSSQTPTTVEPVLQILQLPSKTVYELGESLDLNGLKVNIITADGAKISQNGKDLTVSHTVLNAEGKQKITIKYNDITAYFEVTVNSKHVHKFGDWKTEKEATCSLEGKMYRECECKERETKVIPKLSHDWDEGKVIIKANEQTAGVMQYTCTVCGQTKDEELEKLQASVQTQPKNIAQKLILKGWMIFVPVGIIILVYIITIAVIFKKKV